MSEEAGGEDIAQIVEGTVTLEMGARGKGGRGSGLFLSIDSQGLGVSINGFHTPDAKSGKKALSESPCPQAGRDSITFGLGTIACK